ncbi:MAG TPA: BatA domain-containing protein, partial [Gemmatales bacterium]|nr:BatA domain-containing protein [Gemmatales bacterium]
MSGLFLSPLVLAGSALLALPIVIHLIMRRQPKPLKFPALRFLQERRKTNLQKLRLRHFLLLAMRMLLIGLLCLALARPILSGAPADWAGASKMAVVFVFDSSVSMAYVHEGRSRLHVAKEMSEQLLNQLSRESIVAVIDSAERGSGFVSVADALQLIRTREIREANRPITASVDLGMRLMEQAPADLPLLLCIFSDRTEASWDADYAATTLRATRQAVESKIGRPVRCVYLDLGLAEPRTVAISGLALRLPNDTVVPIEQLRTGSLSPGRVRLQATIRATSTTVNNVVRLIVDGKDHGEKSVQLTAPPGRTATTLVTFDDIEIKHQHVGQVRLKNSDPKDRDDSRDYWNVRHFTLSCQERQILLLADNPDDAIDFQLALESLQTLAVRCIVKKPAECPQPLLPDAYAAVALINVARPNDDLWQKLAEYVELGGGLMLLPGESSAPAAYQTDAALLVTPARLKELRTTPREGTFLDPAGYDHPIMARFKNWDRDLTPGRIFRFWDVEPIAAPQSEVVAPYSLDQRPALVERIFDKQKIAGRVLMLTTALYRRTTPGWVEWNNFLDEQGFWLSLALPYLMTQHVMGGRAEQMNYIVGDPVRFWLPTTLKLGDYHLSGPLTSQGKVPPNATVLTLAEARRAGNYRVRDGSEAGGGGGRAARRAGVPGHAL